MKLDAKLQPAALRPALAKVFDLAGRKVLALNRAWKPAQGAPVFTVRGKYTARGWTEWTQGFQFGMPLLVFDATGRREFLELGKRRTLEYMLPHVTHTGVHDHAFNNLSTYGNLHRLIREGRIKAQPWEREYYSAMIRASGAVQAARWTKSVHGYGFIYSFNGPHSLFIDTMRTLRILGLAHQLGQSLMGENDLRISLLERLVTHGLTTAMLSIYYGHGRDAYDTPAMRGRVTHEAIFNVNNGQFRCPNSQQGYSPFTTWTRGLAWAMLGFAEQLEFLATVKADEFAQAGLPPRIRVLHAFEEAARAACDFYINQASAADGVPYWDTGAPQLHRLGDWQNQPADPFNDFEPVDSSAAAIAAQGLLRLGRYLKGAAAKRYTQAGLTVARTIFNQPYLSTSAKHQGLLLHSIYHRPNGWDYVPKHSKIPNGEASMWGDYHALELALLIHRLADKGTYPTFFDTKM